MRSHEYRESITVIVVAWVLKPLRAEQFIFLLLLYTYLLTQWPPDRSGQNYYVSAATTHI